jgi:aminoglycoside 6'-N-acetyltransferase
MTAGGSMENYTFRAVTHDDLELLAGWLREPHVARWWGDPAEELALIAGDMAEPAISLNLVALNGEAFAYIQSYDTAACGVLTDQPAGTRGIDQFIGVPAMTGIGHGPRFMTAFCNQLFTASARRVVTDPDPANRIAIRAYGKAGFRRIDERILEDGPVVLMARDRATEREP